MDRWMGVQRRQIDCKSEEEGNNASLGDLILVRTITYACMYVMYVSNYLSIHPQALEALGADSTSTTTPENPVGHSPSSPSKERKVPDFYDAR